MADAFDSLLAHRMRQVDWIPVIGCYCASRSGPYVTHIGFCTVGPFELMCYRLDDSREVFDADWAEKEIGVGS